MSTAFSNCPVFKNRLQIEGNYGQIKKRKCIGSMVGGLRFSGWEGEGGCFIAKRGGGWYVKRSRITRGSQITNVQSSKGRVEGDRGRHTSRMGHLMVG